MNIIDTAKRVGVLSLALVSACAPLPPSPKGPIETPTRTPPSALVTSEPPVSNLSELRRENQQSFDLLKDKPLMTNTDFERITSQMINSKSLFFQMLGSNLITLWSHENNPSDIPTWMDETLTPFIITYDDQGRSVAEIIGQPKSASGFKVIFPGNEDSKHPYAESLKLAIHFGSNDAIQKAGNLAEACYLAKAEIAALTPLGIASEMVPFYRQYGYEFYDAKTNLLLSDPRDIEQAGLSLYLSNMTGAQEPNNPWQLSEDELPLLLIGSQMRALFTPDEIPNLPSALTPFATAFQVLNDPQMTSDATRSKVQNLINEWVKSKSYGPPKSYLELIMDEDVYNLLRTIRAKINAPPTKAA